MEEILSSYILAFDELNALTAFSYNNADNDNRTEQVIDDLLSLLIGAYILGIDNASKMLAYDLTADTDLMYAAIFVVIEGKTFEDRIIDHLIKNDLGALQSLMESEFHRVYNNALKDGADTYRSKTDIGVVKQWYTVGDNRVRDTHRYLEGQSVALDEEFYTFDGDSAPFPGGFKKAENNCGCRCIIKLIPNET